MEEKERGKEDLLMRKINQTEGEALPMMEGDIEEKEVTPEVLRTEKNTMGVAGLGGEGTAGRVSVSRSLLLQAPLLP